MYEDLILKGDDAFDRLQRVGVTKGEFIKLCDSIIKQNPNSLDEYGWTVYKLYKKIDSSSFRYFNIPFNLVKLWEENKIQEFENNEYLGVPLPHNGLTLSTEELVQRWQMPLHDILTYERTAVIGSMIYEEWHRKNIGNEKISLRLQDKILYKNEDESFNEEMRKLHQDYQDYLDSLLAEYPELQSSLPFLRENVWAFEKIVPDLYHFVTRTYTLQNDEYYEQYAIKETQQIEQQNCDICKNKQKMFNIMKSAVILGREAEKAIQNGDQLTKNDLKKILEKNKISDKDIPQSWVEIIRKELPAKAIKQHGAPKKNEE